MNHWKRARVELVWEPGARAAWLDVLTKRGRRLSTTSIRADELRELARRARQLANAMDPTP